MGIMGFFYLSQGYSLGSLVLLLPLYIAGVLNHTYSDAIAISALIIIPWYFKFIFGLLSDNYPIASFGRRKPYLVIATIFSYFGWTTLASHTAVNYFFIQSGLLLAIGSALADSVIDGQIVEITPANYSGRVQGVAWGSRGLGIGLAASISPLLVANYGWNQMFIMASVFGVSMSIIVLILPQMEYNREVVGNKFKFIITELKSILSEQSYKFSSRLKFIFLTGASIAVVPMLPIIMEREFGFNYTLIAYGSLSFALGSLLGSILLDIVFDRYDTLRSYKIMVSIFILVILSGLSLIILHIYWMQMLYLFLVGFIAGGFEAYQLKVIQESSSSNHEGTIFSLYTSISNIGQFILGGYIIVKIAEYFDISLFIPLIFSIFPLIFTVRTIINFKY